MSHYEIGDKTYKTPNKKPTKTGQSHAPSPYLAEQRRGCALAAAWATQHKDNSGTGDCTHGTTEYD